MGIFKTSKLLYGNPDFINTIATAIESKFRADGYDGRIDDKVLEIAERIIYASSRN